MKLSLFIFILVAFFASVVFGLAQSGDTEYRVLPGSVVCKSQHPACCYHLSKCKIRYQARGKWMTIQDRTATEDACKGVCGIHFKKCVDMCKCVTSQTEVRSSRSCKCKLAVPMLFVRFRCIKRCIAARNQCENICHTKKCPLKAVTTMTWDKEFDGRCDGICLTENHLSTACPL